MKTKDKLLENYYKAETTAEEETMLRKIILDEEGSSPEKDLFGWYNHSGAVPDDLEEQLFRGIKESERKSAGKKLILYRLTSVAAIVLLLLGLFFGLRAQKFRKMENDFFVMEQALYQVSDVIQPEEENEMLILWVDDNVEIIIN